MPADPPSSPALRASDADRDRVIELLRAAVADEQARPGRVRRTAGRGTGRPHHRRAGPAHRRSDRRAGQRRGAHAAARRDASAEPAAELLTINQRHGSVRRDGRWTLPHRLALRTVWCEVMLDLTSAVRSGPRAGHRAAGPRRRRGSGPRAGHGGGRQRAVGRHHTKLAISRDAGDNTPETLCVRLVGRMRHGRIDTRWLAPRR